MFQNSFVQIVLVEDNDADAEMAILALRQSAVKNPIVRMRNGEDTLGFLISDRAVRPRLRPRRVVLLDLNLPGCHGLEVLRELRSQPSTQQLPVAILTGYGDAHSRVTAMALGAMQYLDKPLTARSATEIIQAALAYWNSPERRSDPADRKMSQL